MQQVESYLLALQEDICQKIAALDGEKAFYTDLWQKPQGGGGRSCVLENGAVFEKAGVNFSHVHGQHLPEAATGKNPQLAGRAFHAMGVSLVFHPVNPYVPTTHMNVRFFMATHPTADPIWWFGGGFDLTPYYGFVEDCVHWHQMARQACLPFGDEIYPRFKQQCDEYFYLPHRQEPRGIGGLFFDDWQEGGFEPSFALMRSVGDHFLPAYVPIVERRQVMPYNEAQQEFQRYRRGRYVEFNLIYDRGTKFGLQFGGRTESILMSLPALASWRYNWHAAPASEEARLTEFYLQPRDWLAMA